MSLGSYTFFHISQDPYNKEDEGGYSVSVYSANAPAKRPSLRVRNMTHNLMVKASVMARNHSSRNKTERESSVSCISVAYSDVISAGLPSLEKPAGSFTSAESWSTSASTRPSVSSQERLTSPSIPRLRQLEGGHGVKAWSRSRSISLRITLLLRELLTIQHVQTHSLIYMSASKLLVNCKGIYSCTFLR